MRLLHVDSLEFQDFRDDVRPPYVIASHRWLDTGEVSFQDFPRVRDGQKADCAGFQKVKAFTTYIQTNLPSLKWLWIDTCCIDKTNAAELSEAINLMFEWYRGADLCLAYLADVEGASDTYTIQESEWFKRGWTLQELLAPGTVVFLSNTWDIIGHKGNVLSPQSGLRFGSNLEKRISRITNIPAEVLHSYRASTEASVEAKLKWMEGRQTTRPEDMWYALFGIVGVTPGANYGEGSEGARQRLLAAVDSRDNRAAQQAKKFRSIADWLAASNPWTNHESARRLHQSHTGTWLLKSDRYQAWKANGIRHLWLYGKAGCGKTILCSTAIVDVKKYCDRRPSTGFAIFYFSFSDDKKQRLVDLLRSLVVQLGWKGQALTALQQAYEQPNRPVLGQVELEKLLTLCFQSYDEVLLLIDALDECPEDEDVRLEMMECLMRLSQKAINVKIFVTSRELPDIRQSMARLGAAPIAAAAKSVNEDIQQYTAAQLSRDPRLSRLDERTKMQINDTISKKADGM
jgi:ankyrin repeat domain-containing protein 50